MRKKKKPPSRRVCQCWRTLRWCHTPPERHPQAEPEPCSACCSPCTRLQHGLKLLPMSFSFQAVKWMNAAVHDFTAALLPISITFLAFMSFARLAINWDCSQATIMALEESSMVFWRRDCKREHRWSSYNQSGAVLQLGPGLLTSLRPFRAGCSLKEWLRTYCISGSLPQWLLMMLILEDVFFPEEETWSKTHTLLTKSRMRRSSHRPTSGLMESFSNRSWKVMEGHALDFELER